MSTTKKRLRDTQPSSTRLLWINGDDYAASQFRSEVRNVDDFVRRWRADQLTDEEKRFDVEVHEFGTVDSEFIGFVRSNVQDHDQRKHADFFILSDASKQ